MSKDDDPELWLDQYGDALFSCAVARVRDHATAEDIVQETLISAVQSASSFEGRSSRLTWLISILKRKVIDHYRRSGSARGGKGQVSLDDLPGEGTPMFNERREFSERLGAWPTDPANALQSKEFWSTFEGCRQDLPQKLLAAFTLREVEQLDTEQVCTELNISASNLAVRIHRARLLMRQCLERKWFESPT